MPFSPQSDQYVSDHRALVRGWTLLALSALGAAGALALALALSRTPVIGQWLPWGPDFFYRALVTHVVLSFQVWFLAMAAVMALLAQGAAPSQTLRKMALWTAWGAFLLLLVPALADRGQPLLNNYVPILVHPVFIAALAVIALAVVATMAPSVSGLFRSGLSGGDAGRFGMGVAGLCLISALVCMALAASGMPAGDNLEFRVERIIWGGGHVGQVLNTVLLLTAWHWLAVRVFGRGPLPQAVAKAALGGLGLFAVLAPVAYGLAPVTGLAHRLAFTRFLWLALPLALSVFAAGLGGRFLRPPPRWKDPLQASLALSLLVTVLGGLAGFFLGVGDTRTPSHYHAVIGGVNLGLMGLFPAMILPLLARLPSGRAVRLLPWSLILYGGGQALHAVGFYAAGLAGVPRKTEGVEQGLNTLAKLLSMGLVGVGGTVAVVGGIGFIWVVLRCLLAGSEGRSGVISPPPVDEPGGRSVILAASAVVVASLALAGIWLKDAWQAGKETAAFSAQPSLGDVSTLDVTLRQWSIEAGDPAPHLVAGRRYRLRLHAADVVHSAAILGQEVLVVPGHDEELTIAVPVGADVPEIRLQCGEFCGNGHSRMTLVFAVDQP